MAKNDDFNDFATSAEKQFIQCGRLNVSEMGARFTQPHRSLLHVKLPDRGRCWRLTPVEGSYWLYSTLLPGMSVNEFLSSLCFFEVHTFQSPVTFLTKKFCNWGSLLPPLVSSQSPPLMVPNGIQKPRKPGDARWGTHRVEDWWGG